MKTATYSAPSNIAFIKYWGATDLDRVLPSNPSISMTLSECRSQTTVRFEPGVRAPDEIFLFDSRDQPVPLTEPFRRGIERHLAAARQRYGIEGCFHIATRNNFPAQAGLASSASGFAALAAGINEAADLGLDPAGLSDLARISGSGSASRSVFGGFVEWPASAEATSARRIAPADYWALSDVIAIVESGGKEVSSRQGHRRAAASPHFARRQELLPQRLATVRSAISNRDLETLGPILEEEAIELHLVAMSSHPPIFYWKPATLTVLEAVRRLRSDGVSAWATMDAGANVHVLCATTSEREVATALSRVPGVLQVLPDRIGTGPRRHEEAVGTAP